MIAVTVFDPVQGCAAGLCGAEPDETPANFAADLIWLEAQGVEIRRFSLGHDPGEFATNPVIRDLLKKEGIASLPVTMIGDEVIATSRYPRREELVQGLRRSQASSSDPADPG